uniref:NADH-ubiquinone oxidoreductase chain 6 n=1 Tax=Xyela sp. ZJUH_2016036 TaxID=2491173 RepID=A0A3Q8UAE3_9HYME|nr:NADH dehydrogenase subunit 6 [Xyela sp. ZJUH_2016036]
MLSSMSMIMGLLFTQLNHPLTMGLMLLIQTMMISLITGMMTQTFWFSYILFLIMLGGMLVLFIYVSSLASNEMFNMSMLNLISTLLIFMFIMLLLLMMDWYSNIFLSLNKEIINIINPEILYNMESTFSLNKIYNQPTNYITLMLANYLFITLIAVVKITNIMKGSLRQKF